ncbi:MAG TPA: helix-turn-helix domain-containing protein [Acidimicrobiales bacterium]|jgi:DNA-binding IclR family transcriptional regulator|nr:helix-turn-helix domain-containing protein [Acidimicrobiales bacterium]
MGLAPSPSARRVVIMLRALAAQPGRGVRATDLAAQVGENRTTCLATLLALEAEGWVRRDAAKRYSLGPAAIAVGNAALAGLPVVDETRAELQALYESTGLEAITGVATGADILVVARAGPERQLAPSARVGDVIPLVPPLGLTYVAFDDAAFERWLASATTSLTHDERQRYRDARNTVRTLGYGVTLDPGTRASFAAALDEFARSPRSAELRARRDRLIQTLAHDDYLVADDNRGRALHVAQLSAPVMGPDDRVAAVIGVVALPRQLSVEDVADIGAEICAAVTRVARRLAAPVAPRVRDRA